MPTLRDYVEHPEKVTETEWNEYYKMTESFIELKKSFSNYDISINTNNSRERISLVFYQEHFIMAGILEAFYISNEISFKELNESLLNYIPKDFIWKVTGNYVNSIIIKMIRLGFIIPLKTEDKYSPKFQITNEGIDSLRQQIFQNLASSSFFNYQALLINKRSLRMNIYMLIVTIASILVTIITILK